MHLPQAIFFIAGLGSLILGAELLVRGASRLAASAGISPLIIGLTIVAFSTSAPELAVSVRSAASGQPDIAFGNAVGSNILNILLILGISAIIRPLAVKSRLIIIDVPVMIGTALLLFLLSLDGMLGRFEGAWLLAGIGAYTGYSIWEGKRQSSQVLSIHETTPSDSPGRNWINILYLFMLIAAGFILLVIGSRWMVIGAVAVARALKVSELLIGLTIVAAGTSLPEAATSIVAAVRGERDIAVGNVVGSNIFNVLFVLGAAAAVSPEGVGISPSAVNFDIPVMIVVSFACLPIFFTGHLIARWEGGLFFGCYLAYIGYLALDATREAALFPLGKSLIVIAGPLLGITLFVLSIRYMKTLRQQP